MYPQCNNYQVYQSLYAFAHSSMFTLILSPTFTHTGVNCMWTLMWITG